MCHSQREVMLNAIKSTINMQMCSIVNDKQCSTGALLTSDIGTEWLHNLGVCIFVMHCAHFRRGPKIFKKGNQEDLVLSKGALFCLKWRKRGPWDKKRKPKGGPKSTKKIPWREPKWAQCSTKMHTPRLCNHSVPLSLVSKAPAPSHSPLILVVHTSNPSEKVPLSSIPAESILPTDEIYSSY